MKKDKTWLKDEVKSLFDEAYDSGKMEYYESEESIHRINSLVDQLDETEVKQLDKKIKELDSYNDELIRDNNQLRNALDNQEVLSQEWIDDHKVARIDNLRKMTTSDVVKVIKLKNLLVPKQDKPVIPKFVADWIESYRKKTLVELINDAVYSSDEDSKCFRRWFHEEMGFESNYSEFLARAWLDGFTVEKEQKYHVVNKENYFMLRKYDGLVDVLHVSSSMSRDEYGKDTRFMLTEKEIKDYDERYIPFMVPVDEVNNK